MGQNTHRTLMQRDFFSQQMPKAESMAVFGFRNVNKFCYFKSMLGTDKTGFKYLSHTTNS